MPIKIFAGFPKRPNPAPVDRVGSTDGLLVYDKNGNGVIDNASEIFGGGTGVDGFAALSAYDSNGDGKIDASDTIFSSLQVWRDINGDGVMNPGELQSLTDAGITSISLNDTAQTGVTVNGNIVQSTSTFTRSDGSTGAIGDIQFNTDPFHSQFDGDSTISADAAAMPDLKGYGTLADLRVAMTLDPSLIATITADLPNLDLTTLDLATLRQALMPILIAWAAASPERAADGTWHSVTPSARPGIAILTSDDGRKLAPVLPANDNACIVRRALAL